MYEALEAMSQVVTGRTDKDLSANRELFVSELGLSDYFKKMLHDYIKYANDFRHATNPNRNRGQPKRKEVEAFVYSTGVFLRLSIERLSADAIIP